MRRKQLRLPDYDYRNPGMYFVTICADERRSIFDDERIVQALTTAWRSVVTHGRSPEPYEFVVMPNHVHGTVTLPGIRGRAAGTGRLPAQRTTSDSDSAPEPPRGIVDAYDTEGTAPLRGYPVVLPGSLGAIVRQFKSIGTARVRRILGVTSAVWQRGYYDRIIRNERELAAVRQYILDNPRKWELDPLRVTN